MTNRRYPIAPVSFKSPFAVSCVSVAFIFASSASTRFSSCVIRFACSSAFMSCHRLRSSSRRDAGQRTPADAQRKKRWANRGSLPAHLPRIHVERATLAFWVGYAAAELKPLYLRLRELSANHRAGKVGLHALNRACRLSGREERFERARQRWRKLRSCVSTWAERIRSICLD